MNQRRIAFYSPLKPATHPVPSGDRLMARSLIVALQEAGFQLEIASEVRAFIKVGTDEVSHAQLLEKTRREIERLSEQWQQEGAPEIWFCYHPYYKSPDLIGPVLCERFGIHYVSAEASYSPRRTQGVWGCMQEAVRLALSQATVNICLTARDQYGLQEALPTAKLARLAPFIDTAEFSRYTRCAQSGHLVCVAMMRSGDKFDSYAHLALALTSLLHLPWTLSVVGDGAAREQVHELFAKIPSERIIWHGQLTRDAIARLFARSAVYLWPGCGEAYGLAYLEAQAAGLPVVAFASAGVPEVVENGYSGLLCSPGNTQEYAVAVSRLLLDDSLRETLADNAVQHVESRHTQASASARLKQILQEYVRCEE